MSRYSLGRRAKTDLDEIWLSLAATENEDFAQRIVDEIGYVFPMLGSMPQSGRIRSDIEPDLRSFPVGDYIIYYRKAKRGGVQIGRVIHAKRDQLKALKGSRRQGSKHN